MQQHATIRRVEPLSIDWQRFALGDSSFDTARRSYTPLVEGTIRIPQFLVLATLQGRAERLEVHSACGHRYRGPEHAGMISIVPANCERRLRLFGVSSRWASLAIDASLVEQAIEAHGGGSPLHAHCVSNIEDAFLLSTLSELTRMRVADGAFDATYFDALLHAAAHHLVRRHLHVDPSASHQKLALARWQMRRITEFVEAHLDTPIRIGDLAGIARLSEGYFHRAFRRTTGMTPLEYINRRRVERAMRLLREDPHASVIDVALRVGYTSPNYFARTFRKCVGLNPAQYRRQQHN